MKMYRKANIQGIFMEHSSECGQTYLMDQLEFYVTLKLADDPSLDGNALIKEFFTRYYGAAAKPMKELYCAIEDAFSNPKYYPVEIQKSPAHQHQNEQMAWGALGTEKRMERFGKLMAQAREAAQTPLEKQRVGMFEKGIWEYMIVGRKKYTTMKPEVDKLRRQPPPRAQVPRSPDAVGDPARVDWSKAAALGGWRTVQGYPTTRKIKAAIIHDGKYLYVQLEEALDPKKLISDKGIWQGDDWEVFFAAQRGKPYRQFGINPKAEYQEIAYGEPVGWNSGVKAISDTKSPDCWRVQLAFPLDRILPGGLKPGGKFYAGFYRATPNLDELLAWSPNFSSSFHDTSRLGELTLEP
jgi:hypothetical protein